MGHDIHFLERLSRVRMHHADTALALYRDPERVRWLLWRLELPPDVGRVALALSREPDSPHVIVARDGGFVTCLGSGMSVSGATRVPRDRLAEVDAELKAFREAELRAASHEGGARALLSRLWKRGATLTREDFQTIDAWIPLLEHEMWPLFYRTGTEIREFERSFVRSRYRKLDDAARKRLRLYWNTSWAIGHLTVLLGRRFDWFASKLAQVEAADPKHLSVFGWSAARTGIMGLVLRAAWAAPYLRDHCLDGWLEEHTAPAMSPARTLHASVGLAAIALAHPELRPTVHAALKDRLPEDLGGRNVGYADDRWVREMQAYLAVTVDVGDDAIIAARDMGRGFLQHQGIDPEIAAAAGPTPLFMFGTSLFFDASAGRTMIFMPAVVGLEAHELYPPADMLENHFRVDTTEDDIVQHLGKLQDYLGDKTPAKAAARPGRNEPCTCGSGRKYKHCCARN